MYRVVLVDDEQLILEGLSKVVKWAAYGCEVIGTARDGKEGLALIRQEKPDIVFSDIRMPNMDGLTMLAAMRSEFPRMLVTVLTAYRDFDYAQLFTLRRFSDMRAWLFKLCDELFARNESVLGKSASVVGYALAYINQHYREGVTLKQVAAECHINTSYLGQVFHKETGSAFTDYVNALRIKEARRLLNNPTLKVYEVAEQVGFTDYHYFLKIFKKVTGITPSDLRN